MLLMLVLLWLVQLMHVDADAGAVLVIGEVGEALLHGVQIARADSAFQDLAPVLLRQTLDIGPHCGIAFSS